MKRNFWVIAISLLLPAFTFAGLEDKVAAAANKNPDSVTIVTFLGAVDNDDIKTVSDYLEQFPSLANVQDGSGNTALMHAIKNRNESMMAILIHKGAEVNYVYDRNGETPLCLALKNKDKDKAFSMADLLLAYNAQPDVFCGGEIRLGPNTLLVGYTPLHYAVYNSMHHAVNTLIYYNANVNRKAKLFVNTDNNTEGIFSEITSVTPFDMVLWTKNQSPNSSLLFITHYLINADAIFSQFSNIELLLDTLITTSMGKNASDVLNILLLKNVIIADNLNHYKLVEDNPLTVAVCYGADPLQKIDVLVKYGAKVTNEQEIQKMIECATTRDNEGNTGILDYLRKLGYKD